MSHDREVEQALAGEGRDDLSRRLAPLQPGQPPTIFVNNVRMGVAEPLDLLANSDGRRRPLVRPEPALRRTPKGPLDYITDEYHTLLQAFGEDLDNPEDGS